MKIKGSMDSKFMDNDQRCNNLVLSNYFNVCLLERATHRIIFLMRLNSLFKDRVVLGFFVRHPLNKIMVFFLNFRLNKLKKPNKTHHYFYKSSISAAMTFLACFIGFTVGVLMA